MDVGVKFHRNIFNEVYLPLLNCNKRYQIIFGGASSGKSVFAVAQRTIWDVMKGGRNYLIIRNTKKTIKGSCFNEITKAIDRMGLNKCFTYNLTDMTITCTNGYQILMEGVDDPQKLKSKIPKRGVITDILIEEATEIGYEDFKIIIKRMRGKAGGLKKRITLVFNPIYKTHWIYREFFAPIGWSDSDTRYEDEKLIILKTTYKDNLSFLEQDDVDDLENEKDPYSLNVYTHGNWGVLGKLVFTNWKVEDLSAIKNQFGTYNNGLDFGFANDPTALSRSAIRGKQLFIVADEPYKTGMLNTDIAEEIRPIIGDEYIFCDSAELKSIWELKNILGINALKSWKGPGSINYGIQYLNQFEIIIDRECQNAKNEFELYQYEKDKDGNYINKPIDKYNHFVDATRYAYSRNIQDRFRDKKTKRLTPKDVGVHLP